MRTVSMGLGTTFAALACCGGAWGQDQIGRSALGVTASFSPNSSHILVGMSQQRQIATLGVQYERTILSTGGVRLDYQVAISPLFTERDPTVTGGTGTDTNGNRVTSPVPTQRVVNVNAPVGYIFGDGPPFLLYPEYRGTQRSYGGMLSPAGVRVSGFNRYKLQPTAAGDFGVVLSPTYLPVNSGSAINFLFSAGAGFEYF